MATLESLADKATRTLDQHVEQFELVVDEYNRASGPDILLDGFKEAAIGFEVVIEAYAERVAELESENETLEARVTELEEERDEMVEIAASLKVERDDLQWRIDGLEK